METVSLEAMRLFGAVAKAQGFTAAAKVLGIPKQTLSRRVAALEATLGVQLMHRTTRRLVLSPVGAAYAERCVELVRLADEANATVTATREVPSGQLRITADPVFGEAFLAPIVVEYARRWPEVELEVVLTRRRVDLIEEGFELAFRVGAVADDPALSASALGPARVRYCASRGYLSAHGTPRTPEALAAHRCIVVASEGVEVRWPFRGVAGPRLVPVHGRLKLTSFELAHQAALAGLGVAIFPEFACAADVKAGRLVPVLEDWLVEAGSVWLVHPTRRFLTARVRAFIALARERLGASALRSGPGRRARHGRRPGRRT